MEYRDDTRLYSALVDLQNAIGTTAREHGFWDDADNIDRKVMLCVTELAEAHEELRNGRTVNEAYYEDTPIGKKPCGFGSEIADCVIRIFDIAAYHDIDLPAIILDKMAYNTKRPYKHGRSF